MRTKEYVMMVQFATVLFTMIQASIWYGVCILYGVPCTLVDAWASYLYGVLRLQYRALVKPRHPSGDTYIL